MLNQSNVLGYGRARFGAMVFFIVPGLAYGLFTARLPAIKAQVGLLESELGIALLLLGAGAVCGLSLANRSVARFGLRPVLLASAVLCMGLLVLSSFAQEREPFMATLTAFGLAMGHLDVSMNVLGISIERAYRQATMNTLHAAYSLGGFLGSLSGGILAGLGMGVSASFMLPGGCVLGLIVLAAGSIFTAEERPNRRRADGRSPRLNRVPSALITCGLLAFIAYEAEGVTGDWGNLYLLQDKAAPEAMAAMVYGVVSVSALLSRLLADQVRSRTGNFPVLLASSLAAMCGMAVVHFSPDWTASLAGIGLGPVVPILFSISGSLPGVTAAQASSFVSLIGYCGLLLCPALFGFVAEHAGLGTVFSTVIGMLMMLAAGAVVLRRH